MLQTASTAMDLHFRVPYSYCCVIVTPAQCIWAIKSSPRWKKDMASVQGGMGATVLLLLFFNIIVIKAMFAE